VLLLVALEAAEELEAAGAEVVGDAAPWMPELHASRRAPPPTTAAPAPAARNKLRRETPFSVTI
jgi:hypothetical protein